jgi:hypothetical protein
MEKKKQYFEIKHIQRKRRNKRQERNEYIIE